MIEAYGWATPNGNKMIIMLEECKLPYRFVPVNLPARDQHSEAFRRLNSLGKIPVLVDHDARDGALTLAESGAILIYLSRKSGCFLPTDAGAEALVLKWLMFLTAHVGPNIGQLHHFMTSAPEPIPYAIARFTDESRRLLGILNRRLAEETYLAGGEYTIADIATWPWVRSWQYTLGYTLDGYDSLRLWFDTISRRPAVCQAIALHDELKRQATDS